MRWFKFSFLKMYFLFKIKTCYLSLDLKYGRELFVVYEDRWRLVWLLCYGFEEKWVGDEFGEWVGLDRGEFYRLW